MKRANEQKQRDKRKNEYDNNKIHAIINMGFGVIQTKENRWNYEYIYTYFDCISEYVSMLLLG